MRPVVFALGVLFAIGSLALHAGPEEGSLSFPQKIGPAVGAEPTGFEMKFRFKAGVRASVTALGDHDPIVPLDIAVYDKNDKLVSKDESKFDFVTASWVPPRTAEYRIVVRNHGTQWNRVYIFVR